MHEGQQEAIRGNLAAQAALVWGQIEDLHRYIRTGEIGAATQGAGRPIEATPEVSRYEEAIRRAGRFVMPDEVDKWLDEKPLEERPVVDLDPARDAPTPTQAFLLDCNAPPAS
jgi:hypothetical protein